MKKLIEKCRSYPGTMVVISDTTVETLYARAFCEALQADRAVYLLTVPPGEGSKSRAVKMALEDQLLELGIEKNDVIIAFGGGVITDLVGFIAATYLRGVTYIAIPTTLMGMVDAAIGGKNGINHDLGKNVFGTIYPPAEVLIEPAFLKSHDSQEGFMEVIKYGLIWDEGLFASLERGETEYIDRCIAIKREIVDKDLTDNGLRRTLNFGHTVAHAVEACTGYAISHGHALWYGLWVESCMSPLSDVELGRIKRLLGDRFPPITIAPEALYEVMRRDKKASQKIPRMVLLEKIGNVLTFNGDYCRPIEREEFLACMKNV